MPSHGTVGDSEGDALIPDLANLKRLYPPEHLFTLITGA